MELFTYDEFILIHRAKINKIVNSLLCFLPLSSPAVALGIRFGAFSEITYDACIIIAAIFILLAAVHFILLKLKPQSLCTVFCGIAALIIETCVFSYFKANIFLTYMLIPIISIFYCQSFIFHISAIFTFVDILVSTFFKNGLYRNDFDLIDFLSSVSGYFIEFLIIYMIGIFLCRALTGYFRRNYITQIEVISGKEDNQKQFETLQSLVDIYLTAHLIDLENDSFVELKSTREINRHIYLEKDFSIKKVMRMAVSSLTDEHYLEQIIYFVNLTTLPQRLKNKKIISIEFIGKIHGWCRASFISVENDGDGNARKVIFTVQVIDDDKKAQLYLLNLSRIDKLTELGNRSAYEACVKQHEIDGVSPVFTIIQFDVNGLKKLNDTKGHAAGDELIKGAADCIKKAFGEKGYCFRTGGDEFIVIIEAEKKQFQKICNNFEKIVSEWKGKYSDEMHISYGYVRGEEMPYTEIIDMAAVADERMYEMKKAFYEQQKSDK